MVLGPSSPVTPMGMQFPPTWCHRPVNLGISDHSTMTPAAHPNSDLLTLNRVAHPSSRPLSKDVVLEISNTPNPPGHG
ncbi:hypothetical protein KJE20_09539 [Pyrenophora tritici-repentis]|uniref:Uncharacterized protein n=1 Tax=Pyrenophora tritici-repentis TaxID=45151 RepID=A0A922N645_9PLEO|nr:hypothetical protein Ptr86124_010784 [Pyrenophora tritici-repentis]KAI1680688.1 hypothetical protein KJE20_09539 [Pyrenophora tritici-repentis]